MGMVFGLNIRFLPFHDLSQMASTFILLLEVFYTCCCKFSAKIIFSSLLPISFSPLTV